MNENEELDIPDARPRTSLGPSYRTHRRSAGMDPGTRRLALIAGGIGAAVLLIVGVWAASGSQSGAVPVIQAQQGPVRVKPANPGGMQVVGLNTGDALSSDSNGNGTLAPAPETPDPAALKAQIAAAKASRPVAAARPAAPKPAAQAVAELTPPAAPVPAAPAPAASAAQTAAPARSAAVRPKAVSAGHGTQVQLAALGSEKAAHAAWAHLQREMPGLLRSRQPEVIRADVNGRTWWRLRTGSFSSIAQASVFCEQVRAKGAGCSIATF